MARSLIIGILIGFGTSIVLAKLGVIGSLVVGFVTGLFVGGGMARGFFAASGVWFIHLLFAALSIGSSFSPFFGTTGGMIIGFSAASMFSLFSIIDLFLYGITGGIGGLLSDND